MDKIFLIIAILLTPLVIAFIFFVVVLLVFRFVYRSDFAVRPTSELQTFHKPNFFKTFFIDLPRCIMRDLANNDPNIFDVYGLILITGPQGCGKTMTLNYLINKYKTIYPRLLIKTNFDTTLTPHRIKDYTDLCNNANGIYGELDCISEIQTWFDCLQSKNFPANFLSVITQQRHVRRCILADSQVFNRISKPLRENCYSIIEPHCFFGCFVFAFHYKIELDDDAHILKKQLIDTFFFVQSDELRNSYDSYSNIDYGLSNLDSAANEKNQIQLHKSVPAPADQEDGLPLTENKIDKSLTAQLDPAHETQILSEKLKTLYLKS